MLWVAIRGFDNDRYAANEGALRGTHAAMAYAPLPKKVVIDPAAVRVTGGELGRGAYSVVVELEVYGTRCAGKRLHEAFFSDDGRITPEDRKVLDDFAKEILRMRKLRHPNIVQYMGIYCEEASVTLVMEYLPSTLAQCLEAEKYRPPNPGIPSHVKTGLLLDIAQGLHFLHSQRIIHRNLSSNNILVSHSWQAKISDLGLAKVMKNLGAVSIRTGPAAASRNGHAHSLNPGSILFMSPESRLAMEIKHGKAACGPKLDCFSFGNLVILVVLQLGWLDDVRLSDVRDTRDGQTEVARRAYYLGQMEDHPLHGLARQCLLDDSDLRPSAEEIVHRLKKVSRDDPPPFADMVDLYLEYVRAKLESSKVADLEKNAAALKQRNEALQAELSKQRTLVKELQRENEAMKVKVKRLSEAKRVQASKEDERSCVASHFFRRGERHTEAPNESTKTDVSTSGRVDVQDKNMPVHRTGHVTSSEKRLSSPVSHKNV